MKNPEPPGPQTEAPPVQQDSLEHMSDTDIAALIEKGQAILAAREDERRKAAEKKKQDEQQAALSEIKRLAKKFGLKVDILAKKRKRGRPPKPKGAAAK